jgi:GT2 family glycosyltransferase
MEQEVKPRPQAENPLVSVIVRTKDRPKLLKTALASIAAQTYRPIEVVLVNDGGCDIDIEELKTILGDVSLNYQRLEKNTGRAHAGNVGIENAKGKYVGFLDDDDEFYPEHLATLASFLCHQAEQREYKVSYTDSHLAKVAVTQDPTGLIETEKFVFFSQDFSFDQLLLENYVPLNCLLFETLVLRSVGGFDESFDLYEDWDLLIRVACRGPFYHIERVTAKVRQWSDSGQITMCMRKDNRDMSSYLRLLEKHRSLITPEVIYRYFVTSGIRLGNVVQSRRELQAREQEWQTDRNLLAERISHLEHEHAQLQQVHKVALLDSDRLRLDNDHLRGDNAVLLDALTEARSYGQQLLVEITEMKSSFGWKILESYRSIKERAFPRSSLRRDFYEMVLKVAKTLKNEGIGAVYGKVRKRIRRKIESARQHRFRAHISSQAQEPSADLTPYRLPVDIVIPVHNGLKELKLCMESVISTTDLSFHRLILIDDRSTDEKTVAYLRHLDTSGRNMTVLFNDSNLGFVKTVNRGMTGSCNDVILLNSDTVVTNGWVEKLQRAAYSRRGVATVTPFSNHANHCSIPEPLKYNFLPDDFTIPSFGEFVEYVSLRYYPEIPSGSGFCLYVTRAALSTVGLFDEELFEKGYGEETDFCLRARKAGFVNLLDDATFIYHWGGVSFESSKSPAELAEKNKMIERNLVRLRSRHPEYENLLSTAVNTTLKPLHEYLRLRLAVRD